MASVHLSALESQLLGQINLTRGRHGLRSLRLSAAPGVYGGDEVTIVTADFGFRY